MTAQSTSVRQDRDRPVSQASGSFCLHWEANRMRIAGQIKRLLDEGFTRKDIIDVYKEGILEELAES